MEQLSVNHLLGIKYLKEEDICLIFKTADHFKEVINRPIKKVPSLRDITIANLFFENSTRTKLSFELAEYGITVNNVLPGFTHTNRLTTLIANKAQTQNVSEEQIAKAMLSSVPAKRFGKAEEVANAIAFLCSPAAGYINGVNVPVDGGRTGTL